MSQVLKTISIPVSAGEFIDKYSISRIRKSKQLSSHEEEYMTVFIHNFDVFTYGGSLAAKCLNELQTVNELIWDANDHLRQAMSNCDADSICDLSTNIVELQDTRYRLKKSLDYKLGYEMQEKQYTESNNEIPSDENTYPF